MTSVNLRVPFKDVKEIVFTDGTAVPTLKKILFAQMEWGTVIDVTVSIPVEHFEKMIPEKEQP